MDTEGAQIVLVSVFSVILVFVGLFLLYRFLAGYFNHVTAEPLLDSS